MKITVKDIRAALQAALPDSLEERLRIIRQTFYSLFNAPPTSSELWVKDIFDDAVVVEAKDGLFRIGYTITDDGVTFAARDEWEEVQLKYIAKASEFAFHGSLEITRMLGSKEKKLAKGSKWEVRILRFGKIKTPPFYLITKEVVEEHLDQFNGAKVYANTTSDLAGHKKNSNEKSVRDIVGVLTDPNIVGSELRATLTLYPSAKDIRENLVFADENDEPMPYELSIDATGNAERRGADIVATTFERVMVDFVERGAADGKVVRMVASQINGGSKAMKEKLLFLFSCLWPAFLAAQSVELPKVNENELFTHLMAANKAMPRFEIPEGLDPSKPEDADKIVEAAFGKIRDQLKTPVKAAKTDEPGDTNKFQAAIDGQAAELKKMQLRASQMMLTAKLSESKLPVPFQDDLKAEFKGRVVEEDEVDAAIKRKRDLWASLTDVKPDNRRLDIRAGMDAIDKVKKGIEGMFLESSAKPLTAEERKDLNPYRSIKAAYVDFTGDDEISGRRDPAHFQASLQTGDFAQVVADALNKRMVREYPMLGLDTWRNFSDVVPLSDFKTQHRIRYGGYGNLPVVGQGAPYQPLTSPTDEEATYTPAKYGGTEDLTRELIMNDDVGALRRITGRLTRSGFQSAHEFVYDLIKPSNTTESVGSPVNIYDGTPLYTTAHGNKATTAFGTDGAAVFAARLRMKKQVDMSSGKRLAINLGFVAIPPDLEEGAYKSLVAAFGQTNDTESFIQSKRIQPIVVDYWTDATDWVGIARDKGGLEVGFINGQETPEIFVSDLANVGSWFTNDKITYKIRYEYGAAILDFRYFDGSVVAG